MFKKVTVILFVLLLLSSCSLKNINLTEPESASFDSGNDNCPDTDDIIADEYRGVWINYNELSMKLLDERHLEYSICAMFLSSSLIILIKAIFLSKILLAMLIRGFLIFGVLFGVSDCF